MRRMIAVLVLASLTVACGDDDPSGPSAPAYLSMVVADVPGNGLARIVTVRGTGWDSVAVRVLSPDGALFARTPAVALVGDSLAEVPVLGLLSGSVFRVAAELWTADEARSGADTFNFETEPLPDWIPPMGVVGQQLAPGYTTLSLPDGGVIVDDQGLVRWYRHAPNGVLNTMQAHADGHYTIQAPDEEPEGFLVLDLAGRATGALACSGRPTRFHEVRVMAGGDAWLLCDETRTMDLSAIGGQPAAEVMATVIQHRAADGSLLFEWNAFDHFAITDLPLSERVGPAVNFTHGNGIDFDTDGNLLASFRSLNEVTKIDRTTGAVLWRFGGLASGFVLQNDPKGAFERQHGLRVAGPFELQLLDNGTSAPSRLARYLVNPVSLVATLVWAFEDSPTTFTNVGGSTVPLPGGGALVSFGRAGRVIEVDGAGNRQWELTGLDGTYVFRAERLPSLYR